MRARGALVRRLCVAVAAAAVSTEALAGDLIFGRREATPLAEANAGRAYWMLLAQCSGIYDAAREYESGRRRVRASNDAKAQATALLADAVARLEADRGIEPQDALALAEQQAALGRSDGQAMIDHSGTDRDSAWNWTRSACVDIWTAYHRRVPH